MASHGLMASLSLRAGHPLTAGHRPPVVLTANLFGVPFAIGGVALGWSRISICTVPATM